MQANWSIELGTDRMFEWPKFDAVDCYFCGLMILFHTVDILVYWLASYYILSCLFGLPSTEDLHISINNIMIKFEFYAELVNNHTGD